jgi:hypothetical protein
MRWFGKSRDWLRHSSGNDAAVKELSGDDLRALLDAEIQESVGMSLSEFTAALEEGRLDPESPGVAGLAILVGARTS